MLNILILDDDHQFCEIFIGYYSKLGYDIYAASTLDIALNIINKIKFDIAFVDYTFFNEENRNGIDFIKECKEKYPETICVLITAYVMQKAEVDLADGIFFKPINYEEVREYLQEIENMTLPKDMSLPKNASFCSKHEGLEKAVNTMVEKVDKVIDGLYGKLDEPNTGYFAEQKQLNGEVRNLMNELSNKKRSNFKILVTTLGAFLTAIGALAVTCIK